MTPWEWHISTIVNKHKCSNDILLLILQLNQWSETNLLISVHLKHHKFMVNYFPYLPKQIVILRVIPKCMIRVTWVTEICPLYLLKPELSLEKTLCSWAFSPEGHKKLYVIRCPQGGVKLYLWIVSSCVSTHVSIQSLKGMTNNYLSEYYM